MTGQSDGGPLAAIHIASAGEAGVFYRVAGVVFLGKSLGASAAGGGGINPVEAAKLGCAILRGPDIGDFADAYEAVDAAGGCALVMPEFGVEQAGLIRPEGSDRTGQAPR
jgi:3-deoxy-D-manno-octulosonic-acid transferase